MCRSKSLCRARVVALPHTPSVDRQSGKAKRAHLRLPIDEIRAANAIEQSARQMH
jgi:hypothetical protein